MVGSQVVLFVRICRCANSAFILLYSLLRSGQLTCILAIRMFSVLCIFAICFARFPGLSLFPHCFMVRSHVVFV